MCYAWMYGCAKMGMHFGLWPGVPEVDKTVLAPGAGWARRTGATIEISHDERCLAGRM